MWSKLHLSEDHLGLAIFDWLFQSSPHRGSKQATGRQQHSSCHTASKRTDRLQPLDLSLNKPVKDFLRKNFEIWYSEQILSQLDEGRSKDTIEPVSLTWSSIKNTKAT